MAVLTNWLKSRKTRLMVGGIVALVATGLSGEVAWSQVLNGSIALVMSNILGIALEDMGKCP